jgi:hypothetical protein
MQAVRPSDSSESPERVQNEWRDDGRTHASPGLGAGPDEQALAHNAIHTTTERDATTVEVNRSPRQAEGLAAPEATQADEHKGVQAEVFVADRCEKSADAVNVWRRALLTLYCGRLHERRDIAQHVAALLRQFQAVRSRMSASLRVLAPTPASESAFCHSSTSRMLSLRSGILPSRGLMWSRTSWRYVCWVVGSPSLMICSSQ